ncbi:hypothetical protein M0C34_17495 [Agarivorans sp. TSD2052]|uniref:hypothetical protein n=1 Tax=Agarivorans sp. TSD2052 TaxID=2937286 RepID=UPI00200DE615|nr:hypothetical protein [Agarivorans sp. TSD2052]UPW18006.1 hypothetical protein M0C34_17495 [Agarivorans sp. TSD2052]
MVKYSLLAIWLALPALMTAQAETLSDPTAPPRNQAQSKAKSKTYLPSLQAIIVGGEQPGAILNQRFISLKDHISGYSLSEVHQDYVVLVKQNQQYRIQLDKVSVKRITVQGQ